MIWRNNSIFNMDSIMTLFTRSLSLLAMIFFIAGCNEKEPTVPMPENPPVIEPEPIQYETFEIGEVPVKGAIESVLINDQMGEQKLVSIETFKGIQFAAQSRFEHSQVTWLEDAINADDYVDATDFGASCPQQQDKTVQTINEDCLYLNIWRPMGTTESEALPVYVFIHGGDFEYGSGSEPLIQGDTVVAQGSDDAQAFIYVSFNYRLGMLGSYWVDGNDNVEGGNFGLGDQKRALEWIANNISDFGGDQSNITLMGQGAGAMSVGILESQSSQEVVAGERFQRAIMQSNPYGFEYKDYDAASSYRKSICKELDVYGFLNCSSNADQQIKEKTIDEILVAQSELLDPVTQLVSWLSANILGEKTTTPMHNFMPFAPYIESNDDQDGYHFTQAPVEEGLTIPTVLGSNAHEANSFGMLPSLTFLIPTVIAELCDSAENSTMLSLCGDDSDVLLNEAEKEQLVETLSEWLDDASNKGYLEKQMLQASYQSALSQSERLTAYGVVTQLFFGLDNIESTNKVLALTDYYPELEDSLEGAIDNMKMYKMLMNDLVFNGPAREVAANSEEQRNTVIMYQFMMEPNFNVWGAPSETTDIFKAIGCISGACNGAELPFVFNKALRFDGSEMTASSKEKALMEKLSRLWFTDLLFEENPYQVADDNVIMIEDSGDISIQYDWDFNHNEGIDPLLRNGRLDGLKDLGYTLNNLL